MAAKKKAKKKAGKKKAAKKESRLSTAKGEIGARRFPLLHVMASTDAGSRREDEAGETTSRQGNSP